MCNGKTASALHSSFLFPLCGGLICPDQILPSTQKIAPIISRVTHRRPLRPVRVPGKQLYSYQYPRQNWPRVSRGILECQG
ncbi:hypothetical protein DFJ58DRAFT_769309 [Suillus subalutaceus]|uniref:uncharacterized protein n=1 Tax=Suillus subalutaceus TaxID=48586 RepID=UPI001B86A72C|nr:uncharacterized protein DFJ58DRAFT_769309 [Suillus subalutaceus]KAG1867294.1 hypothetical protein DFJ58DRAFT_769309 [Suillus subalutaceus]